MRYRISILTVLIILFQSVLNIGFAGAAPVSITPKLVFDKKIYLPGETVTMSLRLTGTKASDKTNSVSFDIGYDGNAFELETGNAKKDIIDGYLKLTTKHDVGSGENKTISVMHVSMEGDTFLKEGKDVFTVRFKARKNAVEGGKAFRLMPVKMLDMDFKGYKINGGRMYSNAVEIGSTPHIKVIIDGQIVNFDVPPQIQNGRTLVPFRKIFETLGAAVEWEPSTKTVTGTKKDNKVVLKVNSTDTIVNGTVKKLDVPPIIKSGRTLVPARYISEALGAKVDWDGDTRTVVITSLAP